MGWGQSIQGVGQGLRPCGGVCREKNLLGVEPLIGSISSPKSERVGPTSHPQIHPQKYLNSSRLFESTTVHVYPRCFHWLLLPANVLVLPANVSRGVRIYARNAELDHLPKAWITESRMPALAAAVAAPIWNLWPEIPADRMPAFRRALLTLPTKWAFVSSESSSQRKKGPTAEPRRLE